MATKVCTKCGKELPATTEFFHKYKKGKFGLKAECKSCVKERIKQHYEQNKEQILERKKQYYEQNKEQIREWKKQYYEQNKEQIYEYQKQYYEQNKEQILERQKQYIKKRRQTDIGFRLLGNCRSRLYKAIKNNSKSASTRELIGCTIEELKQHLESQFTEGISWENYGEWHIDHIIPCASFDFTKEEDQRKAFHFTNLQPLWAEDNLKKGARMFTPFEEIFLKKIE